MPYQNIDVSLSDVEKQAVKDQLAGVLQKLPFLVNLTVDERRAIFKAGPDSLSFVKNALTAAQNNPNIFPPSFSTAAFQRDVELFDALTEIQTIAESILSQIDDTRLAVGGEAMQEATQAYNYVKAAAKGTPGLKPVADQLSERFQRTATPRQPDTPKP